VHQKYQYLSHNPNMIRTHQHYEHLLNLQTAFQLLILMLYHKS
jgi:hypothetical protein